MLGNVKWFNATKGFGFIESSGVDYFVHYKDIETVGFKTLNERDKVEFTPENTNRGMAAKNVTIMRLPANDGL